MKTNKILANIHFLAIENLNENYEYPNFLLTFINTTVTNCYQKIKMLEFLN